MTKELVTIEFRYMDKPISEDFSGSISKTITIGVFDTLDEAIIEGNKTLEIFEKNFKLHTFPNGRIAPKERFSKNGGCFGSANKLITNLAYIQTPFEFYAKITTLKYASIDATISEVLEAKKRHDIYKKQQSED